MPFRTDWVFCPSFGRRHVLACHAFCGKARSGCKSLSCHEGEQARFIEIQKQRDILPAYQRYLPNWEGQEWPDEKKKEEKNEKKKEEVKVDEETFKEGGSV
jgi:hypothetical protein